MKGDNQDPKQDKKDKKEKKEKEVELSEEDQAKKDEVDLLVNVIVTSSVELAGSALTTLREEIRTSTASMTSIPLTIKFLRPHYKTLKNHFDEMPADNKTHLADLLSMLAMSLSAPDKRETLNFKLLGNIDSLEIWGHEYVRHLAGQLVDEFNAREIEADKADLLAIVDKIIPFNMSHNAEPDACDLLLEVEQLERLLPFVDEGNCARVCNYLISSATYAPEPEDGDILRFVLNVHRKQNMLSDAIVIAMKLNDLETVTDIFSNADDAMKKQLALILGRNRLFSVEEDDDDLLDLIGNTKLSEYFLKLGTDLDVLEPKVPEDIYKTHLLDSRFASNLNSQVNSAKQNLAATFVNAFVNAGFQQDKLLNDDSRSWLYKNKDHGKMSAAASLGMIMQWDVEEAPDKIHTLFTSDDKYIRAGSCLGVGVLCSAVHSEFDTALTLLQEPAVSNPEPCVRVGSILGLGIAYAGTSNDTIRESFCDVLAESEDSMEILSACALSLGLIFAGTANGEIAELILTVLQINTEALDSIHTRFLCLGLGLLYLTTQSQADVTLEILSTVEHEATKKYGMMTVETCAYAGTGDVLKIQELLHACGDHLEKDCEFQAVAVIGIALLSLGEDISQEMCLRMFDHMLQYGEETIRRAVPLALGLISLSDPKIAIMDTLSKLSHDSDSDVSQGAIIALGLIGAGTNNSRIAGLLRNLSAYYCKEPDTLFIVRIAQGLLHLGKGTLSLNPFHSHSLLLSLPAIGGILTVLHSCLDFKNLIHGNYHHFLFFIASAMSPRMLMTVDEDMNPLPVTVRVGTAVDTVGRAGKPKTITGFQTHTTPVLIGPRERAELATSEYIPRSTFLEGIVILDKNPDYET